MSIQNSTIVWSFVLIILSSSVDIEAAKATRRGGTKSKSPNPDHYALSYGGSSHGHRNTHHQPVQHQPVNHQPVQQQQVHQQFSPSAPALPSTNNNNNNKPIGWNVPQHNTAEQSKTISNTQSGLPYPNNPPPYTPNAGHNSHSPAGPPPPYSQNPNTGFQSHAPAGPPPPYSHNDGFHSNVPVGQQPPAYQPNGYPMHNSAGSNYPQGQYPGQGVYSPSGAPAGIVPNNQPAPVVNNFYGQPQSGGGSSGGGFLQTALAAGAGSLAGNALYGALKPDSEHKTVIIHENAASSNVAASAPAPAPAVTNAAPAGESTTTVVPAPGNQPIVQQPTVQQPTDPQTTMQQPPQTDVRTAVSTDTTMPLATNVPLAPLPESTNQSSVPLAPLPDSAHVVPTVGETSVAPNQTVTSSTTNVPLAPLPSSDPSAHAQQGSATTFAIFNISLYTIISLIIATVF